MKDKISKKEYFYRGFMIFLVVAACLVFLFLLFKMNSVSYGINKLIKVMQPIIYGIVIAYLVSPIADFVTRGCLKLCNKFIKNAKLSQRISKSCGIALALIVFILILFSIIYLIVPQFIVSVSNIVKTLPEQIDSVIEYFSKLYKGNQKIEQIFLSIVYYGQNWLETDLSAYINTFATGFASGVMGIIVFIKDFVVGIILAIYILYSKQTFKVQFAKLLKAFSNDKNTSVIMNTLRKSNQIFSGFIYGKLLDSLIIGILCFIGLTILDMPYTMLFAVIIGVTNVIPVFGPYIGAIPCAALILLDNPIKGLYFIVFIILLQTLDGNVIGPKILGNSTGLSSFWVVFAIVVGGGFFGVIGMLLGVPVFAVIYYITKTFIDLRIMRKASANEPVENLGEYLDNDFLKF